MPWLSSRQASQTDARQDVTNQCCDETSILTRFGAKSLPNLTKAQRAAFERPHPAFISDLHPPPLSTINSENLRRDSDEQETKGRYLQSGIFSKEPGRHSPSPSSKSKANWFDFSSKNSTCIKSQTKDLYVVGKTLGEGTYGVVKEAIYLPSSESVAIKIIDKKNVKSKYRAPSQQSVLSNGASNNMGSPQPAPHLSELAQTSLPVLIENEINILSQARHPNILRFLDWWDDSKRVFLISELAHGGELFEAIIHRGSFYELDAIRIVEKILQAVKYLHDIGIVHRDIKPENILFKSSSKNIDSLCVADFGISRLVENNEFLSTTIGSVGYLAPEILMQKSYAKPVDIWNVGIIAYILLCGYPPFTGDDIQGQLQSILYGAIEFPAEEWSDLSMTSQEFIQSMLAINSQERPTALQALLHPWILSINEKSNIDASSSDEGVKVLISTDATCKKPDLLPKVRKNLSARARLRRCIAAVQAANKFSQAFKRQSSYSSEEALKSRSLESGSIAEKIKDATNHSIYEDQESSLHNNLQFNKTDNDGCKFNVPSFSTPFIEAHFKEE